MLHITIWVSVQSITLGEKQGTTRYIPFDTTYICGISTLLLLLLMATYRHM